MSLPYLDGGHVAGAEASVQEPVAREAQGRGDFEAGVQAGIVGSDFEAAESLGIACFQEWMKTKQARGYCKSTDLVLTAKSSLAMSV